MTIETELNTLRSMIAAQAATLEAFQRQIAAGRAHINGHAAPQPSPAELIMSHLATANGGKPGHLTIEQLIKLTSLGKSAIWYHINALDAAGRVFIQTTLRNSETGRKYSVIHHADAIAV